MYAQLPSKLPSLNDVLSGHKNILKPPSLSDLSNFNKDYQAHIALLNRRSEKAYRKSFLKFVALEDELLSSLCDSNEFRADMLMRSAMASFGKVESDRMKTTPDQQTRYHHKAEQIHLAALLNFEALESGDHPNPELVAEQRKKETVKTGSKFYAEYMTKRIRIYEHTFSAGTKKQRKLLRKMKIRAALWAAFKAEDRKLISRFADKNHGLMKFASATPEFESEMAGVLPGYHQALAMAAENAGNSEFTGEGALQALKESLNAGGLFDEAALSEIKNTSELIAEARERMAELQGSDTNDEDTKIKKSRDPAVDVVKAKRFWDRLYGGMDFSWENPTGYYPKGLSIVLTGGYKVSGDIGLNVEANSILNGSKMGFGEDLRFDATLVSNYSFGANADYRVWKFVFLGAGIETIINNLEAPAQNQFHALKHYDYSFGMPLILRLISPISALGGSNLEIRYDINSKNNIKPKFDLRVGFLIGRR